MIRAAVLLTALLTVSQARAGDPRHLAGGPPCGPVLVLSHGFGGSANGLGDLAAAAASAGWNVWIMDHPESGPEALRAVLAADDRRAALAAALADPARNAARARDLDHLLATALPRCDARPAVLAGHSMGAQTTMIEAGAANGVGVVGGDRFDAYVALSPQGVGRRFSDGAWSGLKKPVLMVTGTLDRAVEGDFRTRLTAFHGMPADGTKQLAVVAGGTHRDMSGRGDSTAAVLVREIVVDFLRGLVEGDPEVAARAGVELRRK